MTRTNTFHTVESLKAKTIEVGDCWEWQGYLASKRVPQVCHGGNMHSVRRLFSDLMGLGYPEGGYIVPKCENKACVYFAHFKHYTKEKFAVFRSKRAAKSVSGNRMRSIKISAIKRATTAKLTQEQADAIRLSTRPSREEGAIYGVDKTVICRIRAGKSWVNHAGNPFAGLMR
jgi:hypothetical protein